MSLRPGNTERLESITKQLEFAEALKLPQAEKALLPKAVGYLDRGGLTFIKAPLWSWMNMLEVKIVEQLNFRCYRLYGDQLFTVAHTVLKSDQTLLNQFTVGATEATTQATQETIEIVYRTLLSKVCNARFNEFLRSIGKVSCLENKKVVDGSVSLRDELKVYALKKK